MRDDILGRLSSSIFNSGEGWNDSTELSARPVVRMPLSSFYNMDREARPERARERESGR